MAQSVEAVLPRIRSLAKRYARLSCVSADDLESVGVLAVLEAKYEEQGKWVQFAVCVAQNRMRDEIRRAAKYSASRVLYDALSTTATMCMLRKHAAGGFASGVQDEDAYVSEIMGRIKTDALGKMLFAESLGAPVKRKKQRRHRVTLWRALKDVKTQAKTLVSED